MSAGSDTSADDDELDAMMEGVHAGLDLLVEMGHDPMRVAGLAMLAVGVFLANEFGGEEGLEVMKSVTMKVVEDLPASRLH